MFKIGILICGHVRAQMVEKYGEYGDFFKRLLSDQAFEFKEYFVVDNVFPPSVHACDAYVLSGSSHGAYEDLVFIPPLENFIRTAYADKVPMVGICFGHQIIAQALGGRVEKFKEGWAVGPHDYQMDLGQGARPVRLNAMHQDQVVEKPATARLLGSSPFCENAVLAYDEHVISFQPHPEFSNDFTADLISLRRGGGVSEAQADEALARMNEPLASDEIGRFIRSFIKDNLKEKAG